MVSVWPLLLCSTLLAGTLADYDWDDWTELDQYVWADDGAYSYTHLYTYEGYEGVTLYVYNMTSQFYLDATKVDHVLWWHEMGIAVPHDLRYDDAGSMFMLGGSNRNHDPPPPDNESNTMACRLANDTGMVSGYVDQVLNGPIVFDNDPQHRGLTYDAQIAYTMRSYVDDPAWSGPTILSRFPMTKAAKTGVDTIINVARDQEGLELSKIVTTGPSKWGWTTWSHAAVDPRLTGVVPMVFSLINWEQCVMEHYQALGGAWSFAMEPYYNENLTQELTNTDTDVYMYEDMWNYRRRFTLPTFSISATGDEYFLPQDFHAWWDDFPEPKLLWMIPNAEHVMFPHWPDLMENLEAFYVAVVEGFELPRIHWELSEDDDSGEVIMSSDKDPLSVRAWTAVTLPNDTRRDFRLIAGNPPRPHPVRWEEEEVEDLGDNTFRHVADMVEEEWVGHYIEANYPGPYGREFIFSTVVNIVPDTFPADPCESPEECWSVLI